MNRAAPAHVLFDLRTLGRLRPGARTYLSAMADSLLPALLGGDRATVLLTRGEPFPLKPIEHPGVVYVETEHPARTAAGAAELAMLARRLKPDVYWSADATVHPPTHAWRRRKLRTVFAIEGFPRHSDRRGLVAWLERAHRRLTVYPRLLAADALVCPSHALEVRVVARLGLRARRRTRVILNGVHPLFRRHSEEEILEARRAWLVPRRYVIVAGETERADELAVPLRALARNEEVPAAACVIVGDKGLPAALRETIRACHLEGMVRFIDAEAIGAEALSALYGGAAATFEPARGAGYTPSVIRSLACGTPVICAASATNRELYGNAVLSVHPTDTAEWAKAFVALTLSAPLRDRLRARGEACAAERTWERTVRESFALAHELSRRA